MHPHRRTITWIALAILLLLSVPALFAQEIIDPRSGQLFLSVTDLAVQTGPVTLEVRRSLETGKRPPGLLGTRWRLNWESRLSHAGPLVLIEEATGSLSFLQQDPAGEYRSALGDRLVFEKTGQAIRTKSDGTKEIFDAQGRLVERDYRNGNRAVLHYDSDGRVTRIDGPHGSVLRFTMDKAGRVVQIEASTAATVRYVYQGDELTEVHRPSAPPIRYSYFTGGRLARIEDPQSGGVQFVYDFKGRVTSRGWADGSKERYEYDDRTNTVRQIDSVGGITTIQWSPDKRRAEITHPLGHKSVIVSNTAGRPLQMTGPTGASARLTYDAMGRPIVVENPAGQTTRFEYLGETSWPRVMLHPDGTRQVFEYDGHGNLTAVKLGAETVAAFTYYSDGSVATAKGQGRPEQRFTYHSDGRLKSIANALGEATLFEYDSRGNLIREVNPLGGVTVRSYDSQDRLVSLTDPTGGMSRFTYDAKGRLNQVTDSVGGMAQYEFDRRGRLVRETDPKGGVVRYEYDAAGRLVSMVRPGNVVERFRYDVAGNLTEWADRLGRITKYEYDPLGQVTRERGATGLEVRYRYDAMGKLVTLEDSTGAKREFQRDRFGLIVGSVDPVGAATRYQYDPLGNLIVLTDPRGRVKRFSYAPGHALARVQEPSGDAARYEYDAAARLVAIHRPSGGVTKMAYDPMGNLTGSVDPLGNQMRHSYDLAGRLVSTTDAVGRVTRFIYDQAGRLMEKELPDGKRVTYQYDRLGNLVSFDDGVFPVRQRYDPAGRLVRVEYSALKKAVRYEHDASGLRTKLIDSEGRAIRYEYNAQKQMAALVFPDGKRIALTYDVRGRLKSIRYPNGVTGYWEYDAANQITKITYQNRDGKSIAGWTYRYDTVGNPTEQQDIEGRTTHFQYDVAGQLTEEAVHGGTIRYRYLPGGNRASVEEGGTIAPYHYDAADRLIEAGGEQLTYDPNGNVIRRERSRATRVYEYDSDGRLVKVMGPDETTAFGYAPTGQRVWKKGRQGLTYYLYDGLDLIEELAETGKPKATYIHGAGIDRPLAMLRDGQVYYYHPDRLGSIRLLTDDRGLVVAAYDYDAFGGLRAPPGSVSNPFTFTGREWDDSTGLYYYRARYYDARLGRFLSSDPILGRLEEPLETNPYLYVRNNPGRFIDPLGLWTEGQQQVLTDLNRAIDQGKSIAIGRLPDTLPLTQKPGSWVLNTPEWTPELNRAVIRTGIERGSRFVPVSPATPANVTGTVYGEELRQLRAAGYRNIASPRGGWGYVGPAAPSSGPVGGALRVVGVGIDVIDLVTAENKTQALGRITGRLAFAEYGMGVGAFLGPGGAVIGGLAGGLIGGIVGECLVGPCPEGAPPPYLQPEQVTDPIGSQPASGTSAGTPVLVPEPDPHSPLPPTVTPFPPTGPPPTETPPDIPAKPDIVPLPPPPTISVPQMGGGERPPEPPGGEEWPACHPYDPKNPACEPTVGQGAEPPPDQKGATEAGTQFQGQTPGGQSSGPTSGAVGGGPPIEQPGLTPPTETGEPPTVGTGGGVGQGIWCYSEKTGQSYQLPYGPCPSPHLPPPTGGTPHGPGTSWQGLVPPSGGGGGHGGGGHPKPPKDGATGGSGPKSPPTCPPGCHIKPGTNKCHCGGG